MRVQAAEQGRVDAEAALESEQARGKAALDEANGAGPAPAAARCTALCAS